MMVIIKNIDDNNEPSLVIKKSKEYIEGFITLGLGETEFAVNTEELIAGLSPFLIKK